MLAIGNAKPERSIAGKKKRNVDIIACCCVRLIVETMRPTPKVVMI